MSNYIVNSDDLYSVATAIRNATGTNGTLSFPEGYVKAFGTASVLQNDLTEYSNSTVSIIGSYAFSYSSTLETVNFPACLAIEKYAFTSCAKLITISFPVCQTVGPDAFSMCFSLTSAILPECRTINGYAFNACSSMTTVSAPACQTIGSYAFSKCFRLSSLYLNGSTVANLSNSNAFSSTPIAGYSASNNNKYGKIYVKSSLLTNYKTATNWTYFSARMVGI